MSDTDICTNPAFRYSLLISSPYTLESKPRPSGPPMHVASGLFFKNVFIFGANAPWPASASSSAPLYTKCKTCVIPNREGTAASTKKKEKHTLFVLPHHFKKARITAPHSDKKRKKTIATWICKILLLLAWLCLVSRLFCWFLTSQWWRWRRWPHL